MSSIPSGFAVPIQDETQVGEARRAANAFAAKLGFDEDTSGRIAIVVTEAARNLHRHANGGELIFTRFPFEQRPYIEVLAIDQGPGIEDVSKCMRDGYSSAGTPGTGLGAISRLADHFDLHSTPGQGTVLMTRFYAKKATVNLQPSTLDVSATSVSHPGEYLCGDAWATTLDAHRAAFVIADGLGHGEYAEQAAQEAVRIFGQYPGAKPAEILEKMHSALRSTRGAAVALAQIDVRQRQMSFAGVGNIAAEIIANGSSRNLVSLNGIVGHQMRKVQEFVYPWPERAILIMHSDGLGTKWNLDSYAGLSQRAPGVIAGVLYRDFSRRRDDVTVLVARQCKGQ